MHKTRKYITPLATIGGKRRLLDILIPIIEYQIDESKNRHFADIFGGGNKFIPNLSVPLERVIYNEIDMGFANVMRCCKEIDVIQEMVDKAYCDSFEIITKESFENIKRLRDAKSTTMIESAAYTIIVQELSRAADRVTFNQENAYRGISNKKLNTFFELYDVMQNVEVYNVDFKNILPTLVNDPDFFIYLDPPYIETDSYANNIDHGELISIIKYAKASVMLSNFYINGYGDDLLQAGWYRYFLGEISQSSSAKSGKTQEEYIWTNFEVPSYFL